MSRNFITFSFVVVALLGGYRVGTLENTSSVAHQEMNTISTREEKSNVPTADEMYRPICTNTLCMKREKKLDGSDGTGEVVSNEYSVFDKELSLHFHAILLTSSDGYQEVIQKTPDNKYIKIYTGGILSGEKSYQYIQVFHQQQDSGSLMDELTKRFVGLSDLCEVKSYTHNEDGTYTISYIDNDINKVTKSSNPILSGNCITEYTNLYNNTYFKGILGTNTYLFYNKGQEGTRFSEVTSKGDGYY